MKRAAAIILCGLLHACHSPVGPALTIDSIEAFAPLLPDGAGVAYLSIRNHDDREVTLLSVTSAAFARVEIHETLHENDVARMQRVQEVQIPAGESIEFSAGGLHLMLLDPTSGTAVDQDIQFEFIHTEGSVVVNTHLKARIASR